MIILWLSFDCAEDFWGLVSLYAVLVMRLRRRLSSLNRKLMGLSLDSCITIDILDAQYVILDQRGRSNRLGFPHAMKSMAVRLLGGYKSRRKSCYCDQ